MKTHEILIFQKLEGCHEVRGPSIEDPDITAPLKTKQVNIGTEAEPKYATLGDYWDDATVDKVVELLCEYQDLFPTKITDLKGIVGDLGMMKITLKPDAKPVKQRPYHLNPKYKEKVHEELDKMLAAGIIEPVEESDWVSPMVVQEKKQKGEIRICVDLRKLNDACVHDPFPTPFTDEVLENVGGKKHTHSRMGSQGTIRSRSHRKIGARQPSQLNGVVFNTPLCHLD